MAIPEASGSRQKLNTKKSQDFYTTPNTCKYTKYGSLNNQTSKQIRSIRQASIKQASIAAHTCLICLLRSVLDGGSGLRKRNDADTNALHSEPDGYSTTTRTKTLETTITTDKLPSFALVSRTRISTQSTRASANVSSKTSSKPTTTHTPSSTSSTDSEDTVVTAIIQPNRHCPYPYPGGVCGAPKTTLVTTTKADKPETTAKENKPTSSGWCAYPGQVC
jgi:hypothetical protein